MEHWFKDIKFKLNESGDIEPVDVQKPKITLKDLFAWQKAEWEKEGKLNCWWVLASVHNSDRVFVTGCGQQFYATAGAELKTCPRCKKKIKEVE